jgi:hypothetical protein
MTFSSRTFALRDSLDEIMEYVESVRSGGFGALKAGDLELEIAVRPRADRRAKKEAVREALPDDAEDWVRFGYEFRFSEKRYLWNGVPLHVTPGEALFLCRWLAQGEYSPGEKYYLHNLRKRHGAEFLKEAGK